jgi:hypothetical protein
MFLNLEINSVKSNFFVCFCGKISNNDFQSNKPICLLSHLHDLFFESFIEFDYVVRSLDGLIIKA